MRQETHQLCLLKHFDVHVPGQVHYNDTNTVTFFWLLIHDYDANVWL